MSLFRFALIVFTIIIFSVTFYAVQSAGIVWPSVFLGDLFALNWRSQFNTDLVIHLALLGLWVAWREGMSGRGYIFGIFCVIWGGMFTFPYLLITSYKSNGDMRTFFLGVHAR